MRLPAAIGLLVLLDAAALPADARQGAGAEPTPFPAKDAFFAGFEYLTAPARYRLRMEPTLLGARTEQANAIRATCEDPTSRYQLFALLSTQLAEMRRQGGDDPTRQLSDTTVSFNDARELDIQQSGARFLQRTHLPHPMPSVLKAVDVAAIFYPDDNTLEFVEPSAQLGLQTPEMVLGPLPLLAATVRHWKDAAWTWTRVTDEIYSVQIVSDAASLQIVCSAKPPYLPLACAMKPNAPRMALVALGYEESGGIVRLARAIRVSVDEHLVAIDDFSYSQFAYDADDDGIRLEFPPATTFIDKTHGRDDVVLAEEALPATWKAILRASR